MNRILIAIFLSAYALSGYTKDLTFSCVGTIVEDFTFDTKQPSHYEFTDQVGLVVKDKQIVLVGSQNLELATMYEKNGKSYLNFDFVFPICTNKNYEIFANNYSCDFNVIKNAEINLPYKMANNYEIKFNGLTNSLSVLMQPSLAKLTQRNKNKNNYKTQRSTYQCKPVSSSF